MYAQVMERKAETRTVTIASGDTESAVIDTTGYMFGSFQLPAAFTGSGVTIHGAMSADGTFKSVPAYDTNAAGTAYGVITAGADDLRFFPAEISAVPFIKIVSNGTEAADRTITIHLHS